MIDDLKFYGMHRHFTDAGSVLLFGGGMKRGYLHGRTADERPCKTIEKRVVIEDLHASIYHAVGHLSQAFLRDRKAPLLRHPYGLGKPIAALFRLSPESYRRHGAAQRPSNCARHHALLLR